MNQAAEPLTGAVSPIPETGPGALLRQRRTERQLSVEDVAQALRLAPKQLRAIEQDDYDHLPGPTYVRGYLRSYAQFLGLSADTVLEFYNRQPAAAKAIDLAKNAPAPQMNSDHHVIKITTLIVAGLVLGLAAVWWQGRDDSPIRLRKPPAAAKVEADVADAIPAPRQDTTSTLAESRAPATPAPAGDSPPPGPAPVRAPAVATVPTAPTGPRPLVLYFQKDSWAEVRDGAQTRLLYTTISAGKVIRLGGTPPFSVYLGNASGVRVEYNGRPVDVSSHQRGPIARLTVGNGTEQTAQ